VDLSRQGPGGPRFSASFFQQHLSQRSRFAFYIPVDTLATHHASSSPKRDHEVRPGRRDSTLVLFDSNRCNGCRTIRLKYLQPSNPTALLLISTQASERGMRSNSNTISDERSPNSLRLAAKAIPGLIPLFLGTTLFQYRSCHD
jgi:hypothetical protein